MIDEALPDLPPPVPPAQVRPAPPAKTKVYTHKNAPAGLPLPAGFLADINQVEASGRRSNVPLGDRGQARGPFQIHFEYWLDSGVPGSWEQCDNYDYAAKVVTAYLNSYAKKYILSNDQDMLARIHHSLDRRNDGYVEKYRQAKRDRQKRFKVGHKAGQLVNHAVAEAEKQLQLSFKSKNPSEPATARVWPEATADACFDFVSPSKYPRQGGFAYDTGGRPLRPTAWTNDGILCNRCGHVYNPAARPLVSANEVTCPKCYFTAKV